MLNNDLNRLKVLGFSNIFIDIINNMLEKDADKWIDIYDL